MCIFTQHMRYVLRDVALLSIPSSQVNYAPRVNWRDCFPANASLECNLRSRRGFQPFRGSDYRWQPLRHFATCGCLVAGTSLSFECTDN